MLDVLKNQVSGCARCDLCETRTRTVFSRGNPEAEIVFVGEAPGEMEDQSGIPFVGAAGQLFDTLIGAMGFGRDEVYVCNALKCRPPGSRSPTSEEIRECRPYLLEQIRLVQPDVIVVMGRIAYQALLQRMPPSDWRGRWVHHEGTPVMPTYHPAFLLRTPSQKEAVGKDMIKVLKKMGRR